MTFDREAQLQRALTRLLHNWLADGRAQVAQYLADNGNTPPDPARIAAACPLCFNSPAVAAHHLQALGEEARS